MKELSGSATRVVAASIEDCFALLEAVDLYPAWHPEVVREVDVIARGPDGEPSEVRTTLHVARGPLVRDFHLQMAVAAQRPESVTLTRLRNEPSDREAFEVHWQLAQESEARTRMMLRVAANLSVPRLVPVGGVGDAMADGFVAAAATALQTR